MSENDPARRNVPATMDESRSMMEALSADWRSFLKNVRSPARLQTNL